MATFLISLFIKLDLAWLILFYFRNLTWIFCNHFSINSWISHYITLRIILYTYIWNLISELSYMIILLELILNNIRYLKLLIQESLRYILTLVITSVKILILAILAVLVYWLWNLSWAILIIRTLIKIMFTTLIELNWILTILIS